MLEELETRVQLYWEMFYEEEDLTLTDEEREE